MVDAGFHADGLSRLRAVMARHVAGGGPTGLAWLVARGGQAEVGVDGVLVAGGTAPVEADSIFRIASMTKPVTAAAVMALVEDCRLRLDDPVDAWLPELADRSVMRDPAGSPDDVVPARRAITVADLLTFRFGLGFDFAADGPRPLMQRMAEAGLGLGAPQPQSTPGPDEWMRRLGSLPLQHQPGERWLYHTGSDVLGVLVARVADRPFEAYLRERIFDPLGMVDTGFSVPEGSRHRLGGAHRTDPATGDRTLYDAPDGQWSTPPPFQAGGGGLVSTLDDYLRFARMLLNGGSGSGRHDAARRAAPGQHGGRVLSRAAVEVMTTDHLTDEQRTTGGPGDDDSMGWGFGVGVQVRRTGLARSVGSYGWDGGLGSSWANDPNEDLVGILLTNEIWSSPVPPPIVADFWTCAYSAMV